MGGSDDYIDPETLNSAFAKDDGKKLFPSLRLILTACAHSSTLFTMYSFFIIAMH